MPFRDDGNQEQTLLSRARNWNPSSYPHSRVRLTPSLPPLCVASRRHMLACVAAILNFRNLSQHSFLFFALFHAHLAPSSSWSGESKSSMGCYAHGTDTSCGHQCPPCSKHAREPYSYLFRGMRKACKELYSWPRRLPCSSGGVQHPSSAKV